MPGKLTPPPRAWAKATAKRLLAATVDVDTPDPDLPFMAVDAPATPEAAGASGATGSTTAPQRHSSLGPPLEHGSRSFSVGPRLVSQLLACHELDVPTLPGKRGRSAVATNQKPGTPKAWAKAKARLGLGPGRRPVVPTVAADPPDPNLPFMPADNPACTTPEAAGASDGSGNTTAPLPDHIATAQEPKIAKAKMAFAKADRRRRGPRGRIKAKGQGDRRRQRAKAKAKALSTVDGTRTPYTGSYPALTVADRPLASTTVAAVAPAVAHGPPATHQNEMRENATHQRRREGSRAFAAAKVDPLDPHAATPTFVGPLDTTTVADPLAAVDPPDPAGATGGMQLLADYFGSVRDILLASHGGSLDEPAPRLRGRIAAVLLRDLRGSAGAALRGERPCQVDASRPSGPAPSHPSISIRGISYCLCTQCSHEFERDMRSRDRPR